MSTFSAFWNYSLAVLHVLFMPKLLWITCATLGSLPIAALASFRRASAFSGRKNRYLLPFVLLVGFPLSIAIALVFAAPSPSSPNHVGSFLLDALELLALLFGIYCVYRAKGVRWFAAAIVVAEIWLLLAAGFIAGMSVSGDWL
jgi:hypothetical protein